MAEGNVDLSEGHEPFSAAFLMGHDAMAIMLCSFAGSDAIDELAKLSNEVCKLIFVDRKEEEILCLLGHSDKNVGLDVLELIIADRHLRHGEEGLDRMLDRPLG